MSSHRRRRVHGCMSTRRATGASENRPKAQAGAQLWRRTPVDAHQVQAGHSGRGGNNGKAHETAHILRLCLPRRRAANTPVFESLRLPHADPPGSCL